MLDAGAPVDDLDSSGASALLCALQYAQATGNRDVLDLLLVIPHQVATINAMTHKKRLTPLMCAIDLGAPDVVRALLDQKADKNQPALTDNQTPLYDLVSQLLFKVNPNRVFEKLALAPLTEPDLVQQDTPTADFTPGGSLTLCSSNRGVDRDSACHRHHDLLAAMSFIAD